ncbi:MAG: LuxR C-terminal-related transcriptional regulator [Nitrospirae bacterium]|nr:LuxR C-terminal-related transcriptional regulator [Nitrospirota bacterium]
MAKKLTRPMAVTTARLRITDHDVAAMSITSVQQLVRKLQVYQLELEMQNEELRRTQAELDAVRGRHEYVPVGQVTLDGQSMMVEANPMAATLLGINPDGRMGRSRAGFMAAEDEAVSSRSAKGMAKTGAQQSCELRFLTKAGISRWVYVESLEATGGDPRWRMAVGRYNREALPQGARASVGLMSQYPLSPYEQQMMTLVADGKTNKEIGTALSISEKTIRNLLTAVFKKLGATRRSQAAVIFFRTQYLTRDGHES